MVTDHRSEAIKFLQKYKPDIQHAPESDEEKEADEESERDPFGDHEVVEKVQILRYQVLRSANFPSQAT